MLNTVFSALVAFVVSVVIAPPIIKKIKILKFGQKILEDGPIWHAKKENTPTMGGVIFVIAVTVAMLASLPHMILSNDFKPLLMLGVSAVFGGVGFVDDWTKVRHKTNKGLTAIQKLLLQIAAA